MAVTSPDYNDVVSVENTSSETITLWWGSDIYSFPPKAVLKIPRVVAKGSITHESYNMLKIKGEENGQDEGQKVVEEDGQGRVLPEPVVVEPWFNSEWNPQTCEYVECIQYAIKFNLKIPENAPGETIRMMVDEHFIDGLG